MQRTQNIMNQFLLILSLEVRFFLEIGCFHALFRDFGWIRIVKSHSILIICQYSNTNKRIYLSSLQLLCPYGTFISRLYWACLTVNFECNNGHFKQNTFFTFLSMDYLFCKNAEKWHTTCSIPYRVLYLLQNLHFF